MQKRHCRAKIIHERTPQLDQNLWLHWACNMKQREWRVLLWQKAEGRRQKGTRSPLSTVYQSTPALRWSLQAIHSAVQYHQYGPGVDSHRPPIGYDPDHIHGRHNVAHSLATAVLCEPCDGTVSAPSDDMVANVQEPANRLLSTPALTSTLYLEQNRSMEVSEASSH